MQAYDRGVDRKYSETSGAVSCEGKGRLRLFSIGQANPFSTTQGLFLYIWFGDLFFFTRFPMLLNLSHTAIFQAYCMLVGCKDSIFQMFTHLWCKLCLKEYS